MAIRCKHQKRRRSELISGFSLLELSISILIIGIMIASVLPAITQDLHKDKIRHLSEDQERMTRALKAFVKQHGRLPCPAQAGVTSSIATFTDEAANPGSCIGGTPAATPSGVNAVKGLLPAAALGLSKQDAFDPWNRAYTYMVDVRMTEELAIYTYRVEDPSIGIIAKQRRDLVANSTSVEVDRAIVALISHGPNGHGAYLPSGQRLVGHVSNLDELENCDCNALGVATGANSVLTEGVSDGGGINPAGNYDDAIVTLLRSDFVHSTD